MNRSSRNGLRFPLKVEVYLFAQLIYYRVYIRLSYLALGLLYRLRGI
jgi:hypothetical protein